VRKRRRLTRARLRELLDYDPESGEFRWRKDFPRVSAGDVAGCFDREGYRVISIDCRSYPAHQLAWFYMTGRWGRPMIDHRDGNRANNRLSNLRVATSSQNNANRPLPRHNTSGFKGVHFDRRLRKWKACICKDWRTKYLGVFPTPEAAHAAYVAAARKLHGEFARMA
jgi:HNH endonuclease/AP2 domain